MAQSAHDLSIRRRGNPRRCSLGSEVYLEAEQSFALKPFSRSSACVASRPAPPPPSYADACQSSTTSLPYQSRTEGDREEISSASSSSRFPPTDENLSRASTSASIPESTTEWDRAESLSAISFRFGEEVSHPLRSVAGRVESSQTVSLGYLPSVDEVEADALRAAQSRKTDSPSFESSQTGSLGYLPSVDEVEAEACGFAESRKMDSPPYEHPDLSTSSSSPDSICVEVITEAERRDASAFSFEQFSNPPKQPRSPVSTAEEWTRALETSDRPEVSPKRLSDVPELPSPTDEEGREEGTNWPPATWGDSVYRHKRLSDLIEIPEEEVEKRIWTSWRPSEPIALRRARLFNGDELNLAEAGAEARNADALRLGDSLDEFDEIIAPTLEHGASEPTLNVAERVSPDVEKWHSEGRLSPNEMDDIREIPYDRLYDDSSPLPDEAALEDTTSFVYTAGAESDEGSVEESVRMRLRRCESDFEIAMVHEPPRHLLGGSATDVSASESQNKDLRVSEQQSAAGAPPSDPSFNDAAGSTLPPGDGSSNRSSVEMRSLRPLYYHVSEVVSQLNKSSLSIAAVDEEGCEVEKAASVEKTDAADFAPIDPRPKPLEESPRGGSPQSSISTSASSASDDGSAQETSRRESDEAVPENSEVIRTNGRANALRFTAPDSVPPKPPRRHTLPADLPPVCESKNASLSDSSLKLSDIELDRSGKRTSDPQPRRTSDPQPRLVLTVETADKEEESEPLPSSAAEDCIEVLEEGESYFTPFNDEAVKAVTNGRWPTTWERMDDAAPGSVKEIRSERLEGVIRTVSGVKPPPMWEGCPGVIATNPPPRYNSISFKVDADSILALIYDLAKAKELKGVNFILLRDKNSKETRWYIYSRTGQGPSQEEVRQVRFGEIMRRESSAGYKTRLQALGRRPSIIQMLYRAAGRS